MRQSVQQACTAVAIREESKGSQVRLEWVADRPRRRPSFLVRVQSEEVHCRGVISYQITHLLFSPRMTITLKP